MLRATLISAFVVAALLSQAQVSSSCNSVSFKVTLQVGQDFEKELGGGLLFRVKSQKQPGWFVDIVPAEATSQDYIYPVNLPLRFNPNQTLGPGYGESVRSSLAYPHEMQFLLYKPDYDRVFSLVGNVVWSYQTSDPDKALSDYASAARKAKKGRLKVTVSSYKTNATGALARIKLRVQITTPLEFQYAPGLTPISATCPADMDLSIR
ncbi:MAG TPA: hypothetical protein VN901_24420 [Candidatus Acidoferrales bacterium]|nr:hypothetical protein [Candidatus Acidoferrales bacterium]